MPEETKYEDLGKKLFEVFPNLRSTYEAKFDRWGDEEPGPHVIYGDILRPYLKSLLLDEGNDDQLKRIFDFLELLANNSDVKVQEVVAMSVLEYFIGKIDLTKKMQPFTGPTTSKFVEELEEFWARMKENYKKNNFTD